MIKYLYQTYFMSNLKHKVKLSPKLQLGVGRSAGRGSILPYATMIFLVISGVLAIRAGYMVINKSSNVTPPEPQVLGVNDSPVTTESLFQEHVVKSGDTVFSIGQKYNITWTPIATINGLEAPFTLQVGQVLKIPKQ